MVRKPYLAATSKGYGDRGSTQARKRRKPKFPPITGPIYGPPKNRPPARTPRPPAPDPIGAMFDPVRAYLNNLIATQQAEASARSNRTRDIYASLAEYTRGGPEQIQGIYRNAAADQGMLAKGFSDGMRIFQGEQASANNAVLASAGAPEGQMQHPGPEAANVTYGLGGWLPGSTLTTQGAGFASAAALLPGAIAYQGAQAATKALGESDASIAKLRGELAELAAKEAEVRLTVREQRRKERIEFKLERQKAKAKALADREAMAYKWATLDLRTKEAVLRNRNEARRIHQAQQRIGISAGNQSFNEWYKQQQLDLSAQRVEQGWDRLEGRGGKAKPKWTPLQRQRFNSAANVWAKFVIAGGQDEDGNDVPAPALLQALKDLPLEEFPAQFGIQALLRQVRDPKMRQIIRKTAQSLGLLPKAGAARGGRKNTGFVPPLTTSPGGGSEFTYADSEGAPDASGTRRHAAKDWFAPAGSAVFSPEAGRVVEVMPSRGTSGQVFGGVVKVRTADGRVWVFRHVVPGLVRVGQRIRAGSRIASVSPWTGGKTHSHIELWRTLGGGYRYENMIDPMSFFSRSI